MDFVRANIKKLVLLVYILISGSGFHAVNAQQFDVEIDPIAYAMNGFSVHGGYEFGSMRLDLGVYGMDLPEAVHGNKGFDASFIGAGTELDYYFSGSADGFFVGAEAGLSRLKITDTANGSVKDDILYSLGTRIGYRWNTGWESLYVMPWIGLGYTLNAKDYSIDGHTYKNNAFQPFPTVHIGWQF